MAHIFKIGGNTAENKEKIYGAMCGVDGMRKINEVADVGIYLSDSELPFEDISEKVASAISETGGYIIP